MGRPAGKSLNPVAFRDLLDKLSPPLTQAAVAEAANVSAGTLSDLIAGKVRASNETAVALALVLHCDKATLFPEFVQFGPRPRAEGKAAA